jgi:hypothetical protein
MRENLPAALKAIPKLAWRDMTREQLEEERDYWIAKGTASSGDFARACQSYINRMANVDNISTTPGLGIEIVWDSAR